MEILRGFVQPDLKKQKQGFQPALSAQRVGLETRVAPPASITRSHFGAHFPSHPSPSIPILQWGLHKLIPLFSLFPPWDKTLCWQNRNKHTQYCNTETILELKTI